MNKGRWMPLYVDDWRTSVSIMMMDPWEERAYLHLLMACWDDGSVAADDELLAKLSRAGSRWPKCKARVLAQFDHVDGRLVHRRLESARQEANNAAARLAEARERKRVSQEKWRIDNSYRGDLGDISEMSTETPTEISRRCLRESERSPSNRIESNNKTTPPCPPRKRGASAKRPMPDGFSPSLQHAELAHELGVDLGAEFAKFSDYHTAKGSVFKDWEAALRTWLRNAREFSIGGKAHGNGITVAEQTRRNAAIALGRIERREHEAASAASAGGAVGGASAGE